MNPRHRFLTAAGVVLALVAVLLPGAALAHEKRTVGKYTFVVGFLNEPAIQGEPNGLDLTITDANGNPVDGAEKTLKVGIAYSGGTPKDLPLSARFGLHGKYTTQVIPTKVGSYSFVFSGTLNGDPVIETFESGPGRFDDVTSASSLEFPEAVPATADLAQQTQAANDAAQAAIQRATLFGLAGVAVGLIGVVLAIVALVARVRPVTLPEETSDQIRSTVGRG
jgi:hypothetical protein